MDPDGEDFATTGCLDGSVQKDSDIARGIDQITSMFCVSAEYRHCLVKTTETGVAELRTLFQGSRVQRLKSKLVLKELEFFGIILPHQALIAISRIPIRHQILITPI